MLGDSREALDVLFRYAATLRHSSEILPRSQHLCFERKGVLARHTAAKDRRSRRGVDDLLMSDRPADCALELRTNLLSVLDEIELRAVVDVEVCEIDS
jgi:hypothetical protein